MRCFKCNSEVAEGMQFCPYCGSPMISQQQPQQPQQGQYQQPQQGQYQQHYRQQKPQLPQNPRLTIGEAISLASHRLTEIDGRSRRSEYWWWVLVLALGSGVISLIPYVGNLVYIIQFFLMYAITLRRLHDCSAPDWLCKMYPGVFGLYSICMVLFGFYTDAPYGFARDIIRFIDSDGTFFFSIFIVTGILSLIVFVYSIKDSNPEIDPMYGPSPKYTI